MIQINEIKQFSERDLAIKIVIPLLKRMGFRSVTYTCDVDEFGKDIVCYYTNPFGDKKWVGVQVKTVDIHGKSSRSGNIQEVINQIQESFDNPFYHPTYNEEIEINEMFLITSGRITPKAKIAIKNKFLRDAIHFMDGQALANSLEEFVPEIFETYEKARVIKNRIRNLIASGKVVDDIRELEAWFLERRSIELNEKEMAFITSQVFRYFFENTTLRFFHDKIDWEILAWLEDLEGSDSVLSKEIDEFLTYFPYMNEFTTPTLTLAFLKSLKHFEVICPSVYYRLRFDANLFFSRIKKSFEFLDYPYTHQIMAYLMEYSETLDNFCDASNIDLPEKYIFPVLIGMKKYDVAESFLLEKADFGDYFAKAFIFCVKAGLGEACEPKSNIVHKFAEFLQKAQLSSQLMPFIPPNFAILLYWTLRNEKEVKRLLNVEETFHELSNGKYLPEAYKLYVGEAEDFFKEISDVTLPEIPEIFEEMADLRSEMSDFNESLRLLDIAEKNADKFKWDFHLKFVRQHKARCLYRLGRKSEALEIWEALIEEKEKLIDYPLYVACKKELSSKKT